MFSGIEVHKPESPRTSSLSSEKELLYVVFAMYMLPLPAAFCDRNVESEKSYIAIADVWWRKFQI